MATVTPVADEEGNIIDFSYDDGHGGGVIESYDDYYQDSDYNIQHRYANVEEGDEESYWDSPDGTIAQGYFGIAGGPEQYQALTQWAYQNWDPSLVERFDEAVDSEDWGLYEDLLNQLIQDYQGTSYSQPSQYSGDGYVYDPDIEDEDVVVDLDDPETVTQYLDQANHLFFNQEPQGEDWSDELMGIVEDATNAGNEAVANLAAGMAAFHAGEVDLIDVYEYMMSNHSQEEYLQAFVDLFDV